ncbi:hypothetical protein IQ07DRAFT_115802 [Pyrenochaeta sp. DS3sAY3a]|nr:hypothetical protein IQ07DRAFT_115802 [Pyrenochaeta sp. DS3sAY3a]
MSQKSKHPTDNQVSRRPSPPEHLYLFIHDFTYSNSQIPATFQCNRYLGQREFLWDNLTTQNIENHLKSRLSRSTISGFISIFESERTAATFPYITSASPDPKAADMDNCIKIILDTESLAAAWKVTPGEPKIPIWLERGALPKVSGDDSTMPTDDFNTSEVTLWISVDEVRDLLGLNDTYGQKGEWLACGHISAEKTCAKASFQSIHRDERSDQQDSRRLLNFGRVESLRFLKGRVKEHDSPRITDISPEENEHSSDSHAQIRSIEQVILSTTGDLANYDSAYLRATPFEQEESLRRAKPIHRISRTQPRAFEHGEASNDVARSHLHLISQPPPTEGQRSKGKAPMASWSSPPQIPQRTSSLCSVANSQSKARAKRTIPLRPSKALSTPDQLDVQNARELLEMATTMARSKRMAALEKAQQNLQILNDKRKDSAAEQAEMKPKESRRIPREPNGKVATRDFAFEAQSREEEKSLPLLVSERQHTRSSLAVQSRTPEKHPQTPVIPPSQEFLVRRNAHVNKGNELRARLAKLKARDQPSTQLSTKGESTPQKSTVQNRASDSVFQAMGRGLYDCSDFTVPENVCSESYLNEPLDLPTLTPVQSSGESDARSSSNLPYMPRSPYEKWKYGKF